MQYLGQIIARLNSEAAPDLSDQSIEAAISPCIAGRKLTALTKHYRDGGILNVAHLHHLEPRQTVAINGGIHTPQSTPQVTP